MSLDMDAAEFRRLADGVARLAAEYVQQLDERSIQSAATAGELQDRLGGEAPEQGRGAAVLELLAEAVKGCRAQNGRFLGYVMGSGELAGAAADLLASVLNQNLTAWRSSPAGVTIERAVVRWLASAIGCPEHTGSLTGGGSSANLMGLAMAREASAPANERGGARGVVYASEQVHMSIGKAVALLGMGRDNLRLLPTDAQQRMRTDELARAIARDRAAGLVPVAVVAAAGTVATGAIDPLLDVAEIARSERLWFHVDGAYGALAAMVLPERFQGLARADSLSLDAHKWLYQAVDCGCLLFRDRQAARRAFSHTGDYTRSFTDDPVEGFMFFDESMELSRRFRALRLFTSIHYHGMRAFRDAIRSDLALAQGLADLIRREAALELLAPVELSAVCFRHRFADRPDERNAELLGAVNRSGRVYLSNATVGGAFALRACFVNHRTRVQDLAVVVREVLHAARALA